VAHLAEQLDIPMELLLATYLKVRNTASTRLGANTQFAARHRAGVANRQNRRYMNDQATVDQLTGLGVGVGEGLKACAECITQLLQKVVTESVLNSVWLDSAIQLSLTALQEEFNRTALIAMLKNAKRVKGSSNVFPLNPPAFEAFSRLFTGMLSICTAQEDYLNAYGLLEVCLMPYAVMPEPSLDLTICTPRTICSPLIPYTIFPSGGWFILLLPRTRRGRGA
jgi:hypothetical protein